MRLASSKHRTEHLRHRLTVLQGIIDATGAGRVRPCGRCDVRCTCSLRSRTCACLCSAQCTLAPRLLSSDPDYPVELGIVPLSYELNAARLGQSCWSCEGHADSSGNLSRLPRLWFYADDTVAIELLARHVQHIEDSRQLQHPWRVMALIAGQMEVDCPVFTLEPLVQLPADAGAPRNTPNPSGVLAELRRDVSTIATSLGHRVRAQAMKEARAIQTEL